ncbi:MAG: lysine biosynthesis protein LysX [Candidatus Ranarchaeia archaeon]|jgi:[lysine-biosynthesis-protein LysW]--L-2-aminoadipate ligase
MVIGIVYDRVRWNEKALIKEGKNNNIPLKLIDAKGYYLDTKNIHPDFQDVDVFLMRCVSAIRGQYWTQILESYGKTVVNTYDTYIKCVDKLTTTLALIKADIPTPHTSIAFDVDKGVEATESIGYPAFLKPVLGSWGRLISILKDPQSAKAIFEHRRDMGAFYRTMYLQEGINIKNRDIRSFVIGNDVVCAIYRTSPKGEWRTNTAGGGKATVCPVTDEIRDISLKAAQAMGGGILGVDLFEDPKRGLLVNEVNQTCEYHNTVPLTGVNIPLHMLNYCVNLVK